MQQPDSAHTLAKGHNLVPLATVLDAIPTAILLLDKETREIVEVNKAACELIGLPREAILGHPCYQIIGPCPLTRPCLQNEMERTLINQQGREIPILEFLGDMVLNDRPCLACTLVDMTEAKLAKDALIQMNQKLQENDRLKSEFVAIASHELRTPLSVILGGLQLLDQGVAGTLGTKQHKLVQTTTRNVKRLARLVDDLLDVTKIEAGNMTLNTLPTQLSMLVRECCDTYQLLAQENQLTLTCDITQDDPSISIDPDRLRQVIGNLLTNALKFTRAHGQVTVRCKVEQQQVIVSVQDTGVGITEKDLPHLFDKFTQFGQQALSGNKGSGLGLAICKGIIEEHQGRIWAESEQGKGTTISIALPFNGNSHHS